MSRTERVRLLVVTLVGTAALGAMVFVLGTPEPLGRLTLLNAGASGPSAAVLHHDFPDKVLPEGIGHDGQQYYAIARQPMHLDRVAPSLDRPRYRLQRIAFPALVWALHPGGGGEGLLLATFAVGVLGILLGTWATGALGARLGGSPLLALGFLLAPGTMLTLQLSLADTLALAAALATLVALLDGRRNLALATGVLAVLAKESLLLILVGFALGRRDRDAIRAAVVPGLAAAGWWVALRLLVRDNGEGVVEFTYPFGGILDSLPGWIDGKFPLAFALVPLTLAFAVVVLVRVDRSHPLWWPIALQTAFVPFLSRDVLGVDVNAARTTAPLFVMAVIAVATARAGLDADVAEEPVRSRPVGEPA